MSATHAEAPQTQAAQPFNDAVRPFAQLRRSDTAYAGGKGANLGELTSAGLPVPDGFVVGAPAYAEFLAHTGLRERLAALLDSVDVEDTAALQVASAAARELFDQTPVPEPLAHEIRTAYGRLAGGPGGDPILPVAVRSSATAEDTDATSFAGMNETYLNIRGGVAVIDAVRRCWRSLFGSRTIYYRGVNHFGQADMDIAVVVQRQIESTRAGVMFTVNPATGQRDELVIEGSFGLGEAVVSGSVSPDRYVVEKATLAIRRREVHRKELVIEYDPQGHGTRQRTLSEQEALQPVLSDDEVVAVADLGRRIEQHYEFPQDTEWTFDPEGALWMLQSRPITTLHDTVGTELLHGLGIPCVVGTGEATRKLRDGELVTVDATRGVVLEGAPPASNAPSDTTATQSTAAGNNGRAIPGVSAPVTATQILVNLSEPSQVQRVKDLPVDGVGLLRAEMMVLEALAGDHPRTLLEEGRGDEFVARMADGLTTFAQGFAPRPVTYRTIDFRTNEFSGLRGGERFEPHESNPMIGYRGALRYTREPDVFALELAALRQVWDAGLHNLHVMLPFVRTTRELRACRELIAQSGLLDRPGFELWVMAEVPSVLFNLADYAALGVTGISVGSNDLTQLLLGADRDNEVLAETFDERDPAVIAYLRELIPTAHRLGLRTSICGQAPSVHPEYAELLVRAGIDAISVSVDVVARTRALVATAEQRVLLDAARGRGSGEVAPSREPASR
jgi:pyruvate,water dikinase